MYSHRYVGGGSSSFTDIGVLVLGSPKGVRERVSYTGCVHR